MSFVYTMYDFQGSDFGVHIELEGLLFPFLLSSSVKRPEPRWVDVNMARKISSEILLLLWEEDTAG